jgi:hypothetical protein
MNEGVIGNCSTYQSAKVYVSINGREAGYRILLGVGSEKESH